MFQVSAWFEWFINLEQISLHLEGHYPSKALFEDVVRFATVKEVQNDWFEQ
jgi:hypothetical protein